MAHAPTTYLLTYFKVDSRLVQGGFKVGSHTFKVGSNDMVVCLSETGTPGTVLNTAQTLRGRGAVPGTRGGPRGLRHNARLREVS